MPMLMVSIAKWIAAFVYFFLKLLPVKKKRVVLLSRQLNKLSLDYRLLISDLRKRDRSVEIVAVLCRFQSSAGVVREAFRFAWAQLRSMYFLATSEVCVLDGYWPAVSILKHKESLTVIQMWHAAGKIKQSGYQTLGKPYGRREKLSNVMNMHRGYDVIIAGCEKMDPYYCASFNATPDKLFNVGLPRLDWLIRHQPHGRAVLERKHPEYIGRKIILYAPTFRVHDKLDCSALISAFDRPDCALIVRPHQRHETVEGLQFDSCHDCSTAEILCACDYVITDYSAITFEAAAIDAKTVFYLYDYDQYMVNNGLNIDVAEIMPECSFFTAADVARTILNDDYDQAAFERFRRDYLPRNLGHSTENISCLILDCIEKGKYEGIRRHLAGEAETPVSVV